MAKMNTTAAAALVPGLRIQNFSKFMIDSKKRIGNAIGKSHLEHSAFSSGTEEIYYIRTRESLEIQGLEKKLLALPIYSWGEQSAWLVVELDFERDGEEYYLTHVSLKLYAGPTMEATKLYFRAEWDPRDNPHRHAQPHWNIHDIAWNSPIAGNSTNFVDFANAQEPDFLDIVAQEQGINTQSGQPKGEKKDSDLLSQMKKFHFAMAALWHQSNSPDSHVQIATDEKTIVNWIAACAGYIKHQLRLLDA
ncbi:hypothetical protein [Herbaspirillum lusitanum]|uniref:hypothetical protein n=1 Tax=Herbaspirillum lusitanum TaxID=213312 RepID=UPI002238D190|nr:hypothetical protein [Herbaspirillum lusitanum]